MEKKSNIVSFRSAPRKVKFTPQEEINRIRRERREKAYKELKDRQDGKFES